MDSLANQDMSTCVSVLLEALQPNLYNFTVSGRGKIGTKHKKLNPRICLAIDDYIRERFGISSKLVKIRIREYINYIRTKHWGPEGTETDGNDGTDPESD
jgi:hypothetical protein